jgi:ACS family glucarate transporter-like MFS transporter
MVDRAEISLETPTGLTGNGKAVPGKGRGPAQRPTNVRRLVLVLACMLSFVLYLHRYSWGFVKQGVRDEFGWDPVTLGWLDSLFAGSYGLAQIPSGMLGDWFGARALLGSITLLWSLALGGMALASGLASLAAARLAFGVAQAGCYPVLNKVSKNWFPVARRTTAQGWIAVFCGRAGGALSFVLFGTVLLGWLGLPWRGALAVFAVGGAAYAGVFVLLFRNTPCEHPRANSGEAELILAGDPQAAHATRSCLRWGALLRSRSMWFLFVRALASNMADVLFVYWVPLYLADVHGLGATAAGWMAALPLVGGALGGVTSGALQSYLIRRTGDRHWARSGTGLAGKSLAAVFMLVSLAFGQAAFVACTFLVARFFSDWEQPAEWGTVTDIAGRNAATVFACVNTCGALGGFVAGPLTGLVLRAAGGGGPAAGWNAVFVLIALENLVAAAAWLFIDCRQPIDPVLPKEAA